MKYRITDETTQHFGRTLHRIERISNGEKGGFIEYERNLAQVSGNAWVSGNAHVYGNARVSGGKHIAPPLYIQGSKHSITVNTVDIINIGCHSHTLIYWQEHFVAIGRTEKYSKKQVAEYGKYLALIADLIGVST